MLLRVISLISLTRIVSLLIFETSCLVSVIYIIVNTTLPSNRYNNFYAELIMITYLYCEFAQYGHDFDFHKSIV